MSERYPRETCYICDYDTAELLEKHHIVPQRYGGGEGENVVHLCPSCHQAVESLYDKRFYSMLGVEQGNDTKTALRASEAVDEVFHEKGEYDAAREGRRAVLSEFGLGGAECDGCERSGPFREVSEGQVECMQCGKVQDAAPGQPEWVGDVDE